MKAELIDWAVRYILRWFTCPQASNRARRAATSWINNALTLHQATEFNPVMVAHRNPRNNRALGSQRRWHHQPLFDTATTQALANLVDHFLKPAHSGQC